MSVISKNCKIDIKNVKNNIKSIENDKNFAKIENQKIELISWIRTLLCVRKYLPNIINVLDELAIKTATNSMYESCIFGDMKNGTYNQIERLMEINERKVSIINIKLFVDSIINSLEEKYLDFVKYKFIQGKSNKKVAELLSVTERTLCRWHKTVLEKLYKFCNVNGYSLKFIKEQICHEKWIIPHYQKSKKSVELLYAS